MIRRFDWIFSLIFTSLFTRLVHSQDLCENTWVTTAGYNVLGGAYDSTSKTPLQCKASCLQFPNSKGFDFDGASRCWITNSSTLHKDISNISTVTHYELYRGINSCAGSCSAPKSSVAFNALPDTHVMGGDPANDKNFTDCMQACIKDDACVGFDWDDNNTNSRCWLSTRSSNVPTAAAGVTHYVKECVDGGPKVVTSFFVPTNGGISTPFATVPTYTKGTTKGFVRSTTEGMQPKSSTQGMGSRSSPQGLSTTTRNPNRPAQDSVNVYIKGQAIKPAYIVLAGLGAGCIILVIIAVVTLCLYPLKGGDSDNNSYREKKQKKQKGELHTRRPKTLTEEENIGMSTVTTAVNNHHSYDGNSYNKKNSYNSNNHNGTLKEKDRIMSGSAETVDYKRADSGDYNHRQSGGDYNHRVSSGDYDKHNSGDYNHRSSGDYNRHSGADSVGKIKDYEDTTYDKNSHRGSGILDKAEDRVHSMADDAKDDYNHIRNSGADNASYVRDAFD